MGSWQEVNYEQIPLAEDPKEANTQQRRAAIYERVKELGHPALLDRDEKEHLARKFDISYRQVYYDIEAIAEFVRETINGDQHITDVKFVFQKAMSEAISEGRWDEAADIAEQEAEWLEKRGVLDNEQTETVEHEISWREYLEKGSDGEFEDMSESGEIPVETDE